MTPHTPHTRRSRVEEGSALISAVSSSGPYTWARFRALRAWCNWIRGHGCAVLMFARMQERERAELLRINADLQAMFDHVVAQRDTLREASQ